MIKIIKYDGGIEKMGRELVKRISIRNDGKITVNSADSNWYPREYHT